MRTDTKSPTQQHPICFHGHSEEHRPHPLNIPKPTIWIFNTAERLLTHNKITVELTRMECAVLKILTNEPKHVVSNEYIYESLNKDPDNYKGLFMCLSRLQSKFKKASQGETLFRSVRNRGYRLTQTIRIDREYAD